MQEPRPMAEMQTKRKGSCLVEGVDRKGLCAQNEISKEELNIDDLLERIGQCGFYQIRTQFIFMLFMLPLTYQVMIMYFLADNPPWSCKEGSKACRFNGIVASHEGKRFQKRCKLKSEDWEYSRPKNYSIITEFNLVCEKEIIAFTANSILFLGWTIGGFILPYLSDRFGRKTVLFPSAFVIILCAFLCSFAHQMWLFILFRFIIGFCQAGTVNIFVIATEIVGPRYRAVSGTFIWFYFSLAFLIMMTKAYLVQNWRNLEIICSLPFVVIMLSWRYIPESVRWLRMEGRLDEATEILKEMAYVNGKPLTNEVICPFENNIKNKSTIADLFRSPALAVYTIIQLLAWFISGITFYGVSLASNDLGGDLYVDFVLTSIVEFPANVLVIVLTNRCGRRLTTVLNIFLAGLACIGVAIVPSASVDKSYKYVRVGLGMLGKFAVTIYFNAFYIWSAELNPTVVRAQAVGILIAGSRVGAALSPFIMTGLKYVNTALPFALIGVSNLLVGLMCLYLRETKGITAPDTIEHCLELLNIKDGRPLDVSTAASKSRSCEERKVSQDLSIRLGSG